LRYEFPLDKLMHAFKFRAQLALADIFAKALAQRLVDASEDFIHVVPMPMASARLAKRGFDQTALIAEALVRKQPKLTIARLLTKLRDTPPQSGLDREERLKNVRGAFECTKSLTGRHVAILDDVMTTGATLSEAARALKKAGAARVTALAVARADHRNSTATTIPY
jgi:ComF family protein